MLRSVQQLARSFSTDLGASRPVLLAGCCASCVFCVVAVYNMLPTAVSQPKSGWLPAGRELKISTWNIAAINNNPFEYWITYDESPVYQRLMVDLEQVMQSPGDRDLPVERVFTPKMFDMLMKRMGEVGWESLDQVDTLWNANFRQRSIIQGFLRDPMLGKKRLASMPDRITNTIALSGGGLAYRPTVINCFEGDLSSQEIWFDKWMDFFFDQALVLDGDKEPSNVYSILSPILHSKYPAISPEEEAISLPLQIMCQGIFDAILVHLMNTLAPGEWQPMKQEMCHNLNLQKVPRTIEILDKAYSRDDLILLQEVSSDFINHLQRSPLSSRYHIALPAKLDTKRDQNSVILLHKERFPSGAGTEVTPHVEAELKSALPAGARSPLANGDLLTIVAEDVGGHSYILASFHGDTNGLASIPVLTALHKTIQASYPSSKLIFGLDANTYEYPGDKGEKCGVVEFGANFASKGMNSCWGQTPDPTRYTTCNARTFMQPQLNKACPLPQKDSDGVIRKFHKNADVNLKDYIIFYDSQFACAETFRDNTGNHLYEEGKFFPTFAFPSDHGVLSTILRPSRPQREESSHL